MNKEKQIEEMAYEMTQYKEPVCKRIEDNKCLLRFHAHAFIDCHFCKLAEHLITEKGYRKASDVAREIFEEITRYLRLNEDISLKCKEENGEQNREYFKGKLSAFKQIRGFIDAELKKKYTEEGK